MIFETHTLTPPLDEFVEAIFHFKHFTPDHSMERVVPTGHIFIIFELDGLPRNTFDNETLIANQTFTAVWVSGMHKRYLSISAHQDSEMFVIQFKPYGAYPFLHSSVHQLNDKVVDGDEVFGDEIFTLRRQVLDAPTSLEKFTIAQKWLENRMDADKLPGPELLKVVAQLSQQPFAEYQQVVEGYPKTQKHLINQFKKFCGLTPKVFHRILRFNEILAEIQHKKQISWPQIAYQSGFTDQSHFIKEFKAFSGFNPQEYIKQEFNQEEPNFFPLDRQG